MKYLHILAILLFLTMAALQVNDPDPIYWVSVYLASSAIAARHFLAKKANHITYITYGMALAGLLTSFPGAVDYFVSGEWLSITGSMTDDKAYIESARELGGLLIVVIYFAVTHRKPGSSALA